MQRTQIYLTEEQIDALDAQAKAKGVTRSDIIRDAVDRELARPRSLYEAVMAGPGLKGPNWTDAAIAKRKREAHEAYKRRSAERLEEAELRPRRKRGK
jgi:hypothetical protein